MVPDVVLVVVLSELVLVSDVELVVVVAEVYPAGEEEIEGINQGSLVEGLRSHGHRHVEALVSPSALPSLIARISSPGDMVVCLGAGSITNWANALPTELKAIRTPSLEARV